MESPRRGPYSLSGAAFRESSEEQMNKPTTGVLADKDVTERLIEHIRNRTTDPAESALKIPASHFTSQERAAAEIALMKTLPLSVGHISEIPNAGDFVTRSFFNIPMLIVRQKDGSVATFRNMCRHRGGVVEPEESGNKHTFMCQYHGWSYSAEGGGLRPLVYEDTYGEIDYSCNGLIRIKTEVRYGLIFVTLDPKVDRTIAEYMGPEVDGQVDHMKLDKGILFMEKKFTLAMNWKLVMDGAIDSLHPQFLHPKPGGVGSRTVNNTAVFQNYGPHGKMFMPRAKLKKLLQSGEEIESSAKYIGSILQLYPNVIYSDCPDHVEFWTVWPTVGNPGECTIIIRFFANPDALDDEMAARIHKSWAILEVAGMEEDFPMEEAIQRNAFAWPDEMLQYGVNEKSAQNLHRQLKKDLG
jgi:phenylpropionate dioxygenase-like ring-hydroxylating dioxygenase large terminal subunit